MLQCLAQVLRIHSIARVASSVASTSLFIFLFNFPHTHATQRSGSCHATGTRVARSGWRSGSHLGRSAQDCYRRCSRLLSLAHLSLSAC